tara:strand:+ start:341 stop:529 length:189 start_codon:yes stop_codon:yes gene_type:complete
MESSAINFNKKQTQEKLDKLLEGLIECKVRLNNIEKKIDNVNKKTPTRSKGWLIGEYKSYED